MGDEQKPDETKQGPKITDSSVVQQPTTPPQQPPTRPNINQPNNVPEPPRPPEPILVRLIGGDDLEPFEQQTLALNKEALAISRWTFRIGVFGFFAALAAAVFVGSQVQIMSYQTKIMASQAESDAAGGSLSAVQVQKQLLLAQRQTQAAEDNVKAIQVQMRQELRAWVATRGTHIVTLEAGKPIRIDFSLWNAGKTFAVNTVYTGNILTHHGPLDVTKYARSKERPHAHTPPSTAVLFPNIDAVATGYTDQALDQAIVNAINGGIEYLYIFGEIKYEDVFREKHFSKFCAWYVPGEKTFHQCSEYNDAN